MTALSNEEIADWCLVAEMEELTKQFDHDDIGIELFKKQARQLLDGEIYEVKRPSPEDWETVHDKDTNTWTSTNRINGKVTIIRGDEKNRPIYYHSKSRGGVNFTYDTAGKRTPYIVIRGEAVEVKFSQEIKCPE